MSINYKFKKLKKKEKILNSNFRLFTNSLKTRKNQEFLLNLKPIKKTK